MVASQGRIVRALAWFAAVGLLGFHGAARAEVSVEKKPGETVYKFHVEGVGFEKTETPSGKYLRAGLKGVNGYEAVMYRPGEPEIPVIRFYTHGTVKVQSPRNISRGQLASGARVVPNQPPRVKLPTEDEKFLVNEAVYGKAKFLPQKTHEVRETGSVRGRVRKLVTLYPMTYSPATGAYLLRRDFRVKVTHESTDHEPASTTKAFAFVVAERFAESEALARYADAKAARGFEVRHVTVGAQMTPDEIREELKGIYNEDGTALRHALIVGDADLVPGRDSGIINGVTDHYYRAIDTDDYEADINGPDIAVGRLSVQTEAQLETVIGKLERYQAGAFDEQRWLEEAAFIATNDRHEVAEGSHNYAIENHTRPLGYRGVFPQTGETGGDKLYAITHDVSDAKVHEVMGMGRTIINYSGHGSTVSWAGPRVSQSDVRELSDPNALPFVVSNACITGNFRVDESFGETWQRHDAGAIVFWGSMDNTYWTEDDVLERRMYDGIYGDGLQQFDDITQHALAEHWKHFGGQGKSRYYWETYVTFGDPSLRLRTRRARELTLEGPSNLPIGSTRVTYTVLSQEKSPVSDAVVALSTRDGSFVKRARTDQNGHVTLPIATAARNPVTFRVTAFGSDTKAKRDSLEIVPSEQPYLVMSDFTVNGRQREGIYLGETADLGFLVRNMGQQATEGAEVRITSVEGPAEAVSRTVGIPSLAGRDVHRVGGGGLTLKAEDAAAAGSPVRVTFAWTTDEGEAAEHTETFHILRAGLAVTDLNFRGLPRSGGIRPGETGRIFLTVKNTGNEALTGARLHGTADTCVERIQGEVAVDRLPAGESLRLEQPFTVTVSSSCENGDATRVLVEGTYESAVRSVPVSADVSFPAGVVSVQSVEEIGLGLDIPDNGNAVSTAVDVPYQGVVNELGLRIAMTHTYMGDITIKLVHPDGTEALVYDRTDGASDDLNRTFGLGGVDAPALEAFKGKRAEGSWKVVVQDHASRDTGTLTEVELTLKGYLNE